MKANSGTIRPLTSEMSKIGRVGNPTLLPQAEPGEELEFLSVRPITDKEVKIRVRLLEGTNRELREFLKQNHDVFAWSLEVMSGIDQQNISYHLEVRIYAKPVK